MDEHPQLNHNEFQMDDALVGDDFHNLTILNGGKTCLIGGFLMVNNQKDYSSIGCHQGINQSNGPSFWTSNTH